MLGSGRVCGLAQRIYVGALARRPLSGDFPKELPRPFEEIPRAYPLPVANSQRQPAQPLYQQQQQKLEKYGVIYRDTPFAALSADYVLVHKPEDVETVFFKGEGRFPSRCTVSASKAVREELGIGMGVSFLENEEWGAKRTPIAKFALMPQSIRTFHKDFNAVARDLLLALRKSRDKRTEIVHDVTSLLFHWSFECISLFVLGKRMGCLPDPSQAPPDCKSLLQSVHTFFKAKNETAMSDLPLIDQKATKAWRALTDATRNVYTIVLRHIENKIEEIKEREHHRSFELLATPPVPEKVDFLTYMIQAGMLSMQDATLNSFDFIGGGVDTTSQVLAWALYCMAINPEQQDKLRAEICGVVGTADVVTPEHISNMPYLKGCVKETLRLYPVATSTRILKKDVVLSNYHVPTGTSILIPWTVIGRMPDIFHEPLRYIPERWNHDGKSGIGFASLPFGIGRRMCIGRRIAELEIYIALVQIVKNFDISFPDNLPLEIDEQSIGVVPNKPLNVRFRDL